MIKHFDIGNESLGYQGSDFFMALQFVINKCRNSDKDDNQKLRTLAMDIEQTVAKFLNARVSVRWTNRIGTGAVYSRVRTRQHAMFQSAKDSVENNYFWNTADVIDSVKFIGWVNPATGKLDGDYAKIEQTMLLDTNLFFEAGSVELASTVIIHECGHIYTNAFYDGVLAARSLALDWAYKELIKASDKETVKKIIIQTNKAVGLKPADVVTLSTGEDKQKIFTVMAADITRRLVDDDPLEYASYDRAEQMADAYTIRHGAGKALLSSRMLTYKRQRRQHNSNAYNLACGFAISGLIVVLLPLTGTILLTLMALSAFSKRFGGGQATEARAIIGSIANEMVQIVKEGNLPEEDKKALLRDIDEADRNLKAAQKQHLEDGNAFTRFFSRLILDRNVEAEFNEHLEDLSTNRLFTEAAKLSR